MSDLLRDDLDEYVTGEVVPEDGSDVEAPRDADTANALLRRLKYLGRKWRELDDFARAEREKLAEWESDRKGGLERTMEMLERALEGWARSEHERTNRKTWDMPNGVLRLRPKQGTVEVYDEAALVKWIIARGRFELLGLASGGKSKIKKESQTIEGLGQPDPLNVEMRTFITEEGEIVPGIRQAVPKAEGFTVNPAR